MMAALFRGKIPFEEEMSGSPYTSAQEACSQNLTRTTLRGNKCLETFLNFQS